MGRRALLLLAIGLLTSRPAVQTAPPTAAPTAQLVVGQSIEAELSSGQVQAYRLPISRGDFIKITIEQRGIDILAELVDPNGHAVTVDAADDPFRPETLVAIAQSDGTYDVRIAPAPSTAVHGRYLLRVEEVRAALPIDDVRIRAESAFQRGHALRLSGVPGAYPDALREFNAAMDDYRRAADRPGEMKTLIEIAATQFFLARPETLETAQQGERVARELGDKAALAAALHAIGLGYERQGDVPSALRAHEASAAMSAAIGNGKEEAIALNSAGIQYGRAGDAEKAVARFEEARPFARAAGDQTLAWMVLNNIGIAYKDLGEYEKSLKAYEDALSNPRAAQNAEARAVVLNNMGNLHERLGDNRKALELHVEALALSRQSGGRETEARSLNTIGETYFALGEYAKALDYHQQALMIRRQLQDWAGQASTLDGAGRAWHKLGDSDQALDALREALAIRHRVHEEYGEPSTLRNIALVERDRGNLAEALSNIEAAVDLEERLRSRITSPALRATFVAADHDKYELFIDILQRQHAADPTASHDAAAFEVSERARARVLLESMLDARVDVRQGIDPVLVERERLLQKQLTDAAAQLSRSLARASGGPNNDQNGGAAERLERLTTDYQQVQAEIRRESPRYAALMQPQPLTAAEIQRQVLDNRTVLLEFALGDERSWLWAVTPDRIISVELPPRKEIDAAARVLYAQLIARQRRPVEKSAEYATRVAAADTEYRRLARQVSNTIFGGIAERLVHEWQRKRLAVVADGALEYVPFAALPLPNSRGRLGLDHEIVTIPSASVLAAVRRETAGRAPAPRTIAILADPVFETADPRVSAASTRLIAAKSRDEFGRLPFSREEADAIARLDSSGRAFEATDFKASRDAVLNGAVNGYRIVHFATHGVVNSERPALSSLVLSLVDASGKPQNGYLRLADIYNMRLDANLVVLSACQTALGKEIRGEGLVGLARAFMYAGAPRVVASLWQVNDVATAELMTRFYRAMLQDKLRPAAALRAAQIDLARDPRWTSPYYWAGFTLQGDWK